MGGTVEGTVAVEVEVEALTDIAAMRSDHMAVVIAEDTMTKTNTTMMTVLGVEGEEALALVEGGTGLPRGKLVLRGERKLSNGIGNVKVVLRGEQKLSNGTGNAKRQTLLIGIAILLAIITMIAMDIHNMETSTMISRNSNSNPSMENIATDLISAVWLLGALSLE